MTTYKSVKYNISGADLTAIPTSAITTGTMADARISASSVTQHAATYDDNKLQSNIALLGFKTAVNGSLAKYNLQDQIIDEYTDATGVDASASTNEVLTAGVYAGASLATITHDADATGTDGLYTWYKWTDTGATGSYSITGTASHDYLVIAGGGGGGNSRGGGGGAGGYLTTTGLSLVGGTTYTMTIGAGGAGGSDGGSTRGATGSASSIAGSDITDVTTVGGGGAGSDDETGLTGGSGGGGGGGGNFAGGSATAGQGYAGGNSVSGFSGNTGAGGGGAGGAGTTGNPLAGAGGAGASNSYDGSATVRASGGGGGSGSTTATPTATAGGGGRGGWGGGTTTGGNGTANTGGGGGGGTSSGGAANGGDGGSGIIIIRRLTASGTVAGGNITLQSNDTTASTANPDYADMVCLMENAEGTATLNTDIKGFISEDSGVTFTEGVLVDEGTWGTNKKIIAFHDLDISAQTGSAMCYKITTHNQSAGSKETKIHATSIGWR